MTPQSLLVQQNKVSFSPEFNLVLRPGIKFNREIKKSEPPVELVQRFTSDFVGIQCLLITFTLVLKLVGKQRLLGAHRGEPDLVFIIVTVLPQAVEAIFLTIRLGCAHAPDDARCHHQRCHGGRWKDEEKCTSHLDSILHTQFVAGRTLKDLTQYKHCTFLVPMTDLVGRHFDISVENKNIFNRCDCNLV